MLNPPIFITLTDSKTGDLVDFTISRIHTIEGPVTETSPPRRFTRIKTWMDHGILTPQGIQVGWNELHVRESKDEIHAFIREAVLEFQKMLMDNSNPDKFLYDQE